MCAKLRTVAASNNRDHSIIACSRHIHIFVLRSHPVRGESRNQRNTIGEVATIEYIFYYSGFLSNFRLP